MDEIVETHSIMVYLAPNTGHTTKHKEYSEKCLLYKVDGAYIKIVLYIYVYISILSFSSCCDVCNL